MKRTSVKRIIATPLSLNHSKMDDSNSKSKTMDQWDEIDSWDEESSTEEDWVPYGRSCHSKFNNFHNEGAGERSSSERGDAIRKFV